MIGMADNQRCTHSEWEEFRKMVAHGMLFEVVKWIDQRKANSPPGEQAHFCIRVCPVGTEFEHDAGSLGAGQAGGARGDSRIRKSCHALRQ